MVSTTSLREKQVSTVGEVLQPNPIFAVWVLFVRTIPVHWIDSTTSLELSQMFDAANHQAKAIGGERGEWFLTNVTPFLRQFAYVSDDYYIALRQLANIESQVDADVRAIEALRSRHYHVLLSIAEMICELAVPSDPFYSLAMFPPDMILSQMAESQV